MVTVRQKFIVTFSNSFSSPTVELLLMTRWTPEEKPARLLVQMQLLMSALIPLVLVQVLYLIQVLVVLPDLALPKTLVLILILAEMSVVLALVVVLDLVVLLDMVL